MKIVVFLVSLLLVSGCTTAQGLVTCDNAPKLREYAMTTLRVLDQVCPVVIPNDEVVGADAE